MNNNNSNQHNHDPPNMDPFNMFDLDTEIDFETAYQMLSNFDDIDYHTNPTNNSNNPLGILNEKNTFIIKQETSVDNNNNNNLFNIQETNSLPNISHTNILNNSSLNLELPEVTMEKLLNNVDINQHKPNQLQNITSPTTYLHNTSQHYEINAHNLDTEHSLSDSANSHHNSIHKYHHLHNRNHNNHHSHHNHHSNDIHTIPKHPFEGDQLLSAFESNAIEYFLDTLLTNDQKTDKASSGNTHASSTSPNATLVNQNINNTDHNSYSDGHTLDANIKNEAIITEKKSRMDQNNIKVATFTDPVYVDKDYVPLPIEFPDIKLNSVQIPEKIVHDAKAIKKWRHVEIEKIRRNHTRKKYDELIGMTKKRNNNESMKRISKHILLSNVVNDIKSLLKANRQLEEMLKEHL